MRLPGLNRIYLTGSSVSVNGSLADQFSLKQGVPQGSCLWAPCFSLSTCANCFRSLNTTSHKSTVLRTIHSCMYHSALIDLRMLILPSSP